MTLFRMRALGAILRERRVDAEASNSRKSSAECPGQSRGARETLVAALRLPKPRYDAA